MARRAITRPNRARQWARAAKMFRRRVAKGKVGKVRQPVQYFKRSQFIQSAVSVPSATIPGYTFGSYTFNLAGVPAVSDFVTLYDQYKIAGIKWTLIPKYNSIEMAPGSSGGINNQTQVFSVLDYDDSQVPTSIDTLMQYQNMKMTRGGRTHKRYFKPRQLRNVYRGPLVGDGHEVIPARWNDMSYQDVVHYGLKYAVQQSANVPQEFDLRIDYYLCMKNVR